MNVYSDIGFIDLNELSIISDNDISRLLLEYESESVDKDRKNAILQKLMMSPQNKKYLNKLESIAINNDNSYWEAMLNGNAYPAYIHKNKKSETTETSYLSLPYTSYSLSHYFAEGEYKGLDEKLYPVESEWYNNYGFAKPPVELLNYDLNSSYTLLKIAFEYGLPGYHRGGKKGQETIQVSFSDNSYLLNKNVWQISDDIPMAKYYITDYAFSSSSRAYYLRYGLYYGNVDCIEIILRYDKDTLKINGVWIALVA